MNGLDWRALFFAGVFGCGQPGFDALPLPDADRADADVADVALPPANSAFDYQLGGPYPPPVDVAILVRDRTSAPVPGLYNVCYVNGFQTQPNERELCLTEYPDLLLRDEAGEPIVDSEWDEYILDVRTEDKRNQIAGIIGEWIEGCASAGFDALEIDNLDTYSRSGGRIDQDDAVAMMQRFATQAHARGLAVAQKNAAEVLQRRSETATDFAVVEECNRYRECEDFIAVYGKALLMIEYRPQDFESGCRDFPDLSIVYRDRDLVPKGSAGYVYESC